MVLRDSFNHARWWAVKIEASVYSSTLDNNAILFSIIAFLIILILQYFRVPICYCMCNTFALSLPYKANHAKMTIWGTSLYLTAFEISEKGKIPLAQNHQYFFLTINTSWVTNIHAVSTTEFYHIFFIQKLGSSLLGMHLQSSMHPLQCRRRGKEEARKLKWQPIPTCVSSSVCKPRTVMKLQTFQHLQGWLFLQDLHQAACTCPPFVPGSPTIRFQICVTLTQLCCERWCSGSLPEPSFSL